MDTANTHPDKKIVDLFKIGHLSVEDTGAVVIESPHQSVYTIEIIGQVDDPNAKTNTGNGLLGNRAKPKNIIISQQCHPYADPVATEHFGTPVFRYAAVFPKLKTGTYQLGNRNIRVSVFDRRVTYHYLTTLAWQNSWWQQLDMNFKRSQIDGLLAQLDPKERTLAVRRFDLIVGEILRERLGRSRTSEPIWDRLKIQNTRPTVMPPLAR